MDFLRRKIKEKFGSFSAFAKVIKMSRQILSQKLSNKTDIARDEIIEWSKLLDIESKNIHIYFLTQQKPLL